MRQNIHNRTHPRSQGDECPCHIWKWFLKNYGRESANGVRQPCRRPPARATIKNKRPPPILHYNISMCYNMAAGGLSFPSAAQIMTKNTDYNRDSTKRRRVNTGGCSERLNQPIRGVSYAQAADLNVSSFSVNQKIAFLCSKMTVVETFTSEMVHRKAILNKACDFIDDLSIQIGIMGERFSKQKMCLIDLEAWSRRNNLIFTGIDEPDSENPEQCEAVLVDFL